jgi:carbohydrate kinase (thermoresistant glucokinase family)
MSGQRATPVIAVIMGVAGSGKTTVAAMLAATLDCPFQEGDALHPPANVEKMSHGTPLTDADRLPWLRKIAEQIDAWRVQRQSGVVTCSALKRAYRDIIIGTRRDVALVYLKGSRELVRQRMAMRQEHFMPVALLDSQFATLQEPTPDEQAIVVDIDGQPQEVARRIVQQLGARDRGNRHGARAGNASTGEQP